MTRVHTRKTSSAKTLSHGALKPQQARGQPRLLDRSRIAIPEYKQTKQTKPAKMASSRGMKSIQQPRVQSAAKVTSKHIRLKGASQGRPKEVAYQQTKRELTTNSIGNIEPSLWEQNMGATKPAYASQSVHSAPRSYGGHAKARTTYSNDTKWAHEDYGPPPPDEESDTMDGGMVTHHVEVRTSSKGGGCCLVM